jgi:HD-like signal output (HDOD) protein/CheY-like chemotaxis protein
MKTILFVDDEPMVLQGLQRQLRPMHNEWDMNFFDGGQKALDFMVAHPVDIVVSDMVMPGMDGSQLLNEIVKRHPQTVRIILSGHAEREAVLRLVGPAHQYLSKPCDADDLRQAITGAFALRDLLGNERLKQLTTRIKNLPILPALQNQLTAELRKDSPSIDHIGEIISRDIGMTAKILQLVNSAFFGLAQPISNATEAVQYLGMNTVRSLALSVGVFSQYDQKLCKSFSLDVLAKHSWMTGVLARQLAQLERKDSKMLEQCFLAGLLHDIGQLVLAFGLHEEYSEIIAKSAKESLPVWQVEQQILGASHSDVGAYLLALWGLPNPIIEAVALHHEPAHCVAPEFSPGIAVHVADVFAHEFSGTNTELPPPRLDTDYLTRLGFGERIATWRASCQETLEA